MEIQLSAAVLMNSMLQRVPSKKAVWSTKPVKTQGKKPTRDTKLRIAWIVSIKVRLLSGWPHNGHWSSVCWVSDRSV